MEAYERLIQEAAEAPFEETVDIFRSGWQKGLFFNALDPFILEDIANACNVNIDSQARKISAEKVNDGLIRSIEFQTFSQRVATARTVINSGGC